MSTWHRKKHNFHHVKRRRHAQQWMKNLISKNFPNFWHRPEKKKFFEWKPPQERLGESKNVARATHGDWMELNSNFASWNSPCIRIQDDACFLFMQKKLISREREAGDVCNVYSIPVSQHHFTFSVHVYLWLLLMLLCSAFW